MHSYPQPTKLTIKPPPMMFDFEATKNINENSRFPVPTPPLSSESPVVELAPMMDMCDITDNRPPSPESPNIKRFIVHEIHEQPVHAIRPCPLEPNPQFDDDKVFFPLGLYEPLKTPHSFLIPSSIQIPIPRRSPQISYQDPFFKAIQSSPMSPTMAAASASAAASAAHRHPGSQVAASLLKSIHPAEEEEMESDIAVAFDCYSQSYKQSLARTNVDQSMFLTKNAHIKRPRNAWIHFRCHYGQALKIQDPTLRAEEISKRASRRWSKLTENEKKPWHGLAEQEKLAHREAFPEYRYCPRRATPTLSPKRSIKELEMHDDSLQQKKVKRKSK